MEIALDPVTDFAAPALAALAQLYQYDFSEIEGGITGLDGRFAYLDDLNDRLARPGSSAWLFRVTDPTLMAATLAGFAVVVDFREGGADWAIDEFFVMRKFRRLGVGRAAAASLMHRAPGVWVVQGTRHNAAARDFWTRVIDDVAAGPIERADNPAVIYPSWGFRFTVAPSAT